MTKMSSTQCASGCASQRARKRVRHPKSAAQRSREYRERRKLRAAPLPLELVIVNDVAFKPQLSSVDPIADDGHFTETCHVEPVAELLTKKTPKSAAQRCREYRARKKQMRAAARLTFTPESSISADTNSEDLFESHDVKLTPPMPNGQVSPKPTPKTGAQRAKEYRARKKMKIAESTSTSLERRTSTVMQSLQADFRRLAGNKLEIICKQLIDLISTRKNLSLFTLNCESSEADPAEVRDEVQQKSTVLILTETWSRDEEAFDVPNFDCIVKFNSTGGKSNNIGIYDDSSSRPTAATPHILMSLNQLNTASLCTTPVGDISVMRCALDNGQFIVMVAVYILPNQRVEDVTDFIHEVLLVYTPEGAALLKKDYDKLPMIMSGDFNVNLAKSEAQELIDFLDDKLKLKLNGNRMIPMTRTGTPSDAVFSRHLDKLRSQTYVSYFSYHKPIVGFSNSDGDLV